MTVLKLRVSNSDIQKCQKIYPTDAGFDVAAIDGPYTLLPMSRVLIHTGIYADIPAGYEIQVRSRSGLALRKGIFVLNSPGTIDENYIGEINVILFNTNTEEFHINNGDRIAQFVLKEIPVYTIEFVDEIIKESRGGAFGHSGI